MGTVSILPWGFLDPALVGRLIRAPGRSPAHRRGPRIGRPGKPQPPPIGFRGAVVERVSVSAALDPYLSLKALSGYSGLSLRTLRDRLKDPTHPLPCYQIGGPGSKIVVRRSEYDAWVARYRRVGDPDLDRVVADVVRDIRGPGLIKPRKPGKPRKPVEPHDPNPNGLRPTQRGTIPAPTGPACLMQETA